MRTGKRAFSWFFCRVLRVIEINRRFHNTRSLRFLPGVTYVNTKQNFSTSSRMQDSSQGTNSGSSSSGSNDEGSSSTGSAPKKRKGLLAALRKAKDSEEHLKTKVKMERKVEDIKYSTSVQRQEIKQSSSPGTRAASSTSKDEYSSSSGSDSESDKDEKQKTGLISMLSKMKAQKETWIASEETKGESSPQVKQDSDPKSLMPKMTARDDTSGNELISKLKEFKRSEDQPDPLSFTTKMKSNEYESETKLEKSLKQIGKRGDEKGLQSMMTKMKENEVKWEGKMESEAEKMKDSEDKPMGLLAMITKMKASEHKLGEDAKSKLQEIMHSVDNQLVKEALKLSEKLPGDKEKSEYELVGQLLTQFETTAKQRKGRQPKRYEERDLRTVVEGLSVIIDNMKPEDESYVYNEEVDTEVRTLLFRTGGTDLFSGIPLGIFTKSDMKSTRAEKKTLFEIVEEEKKKSATFLPNNAFDEQIQWTKEGKLWTFPIDNEAGWDSEKKVDYSEHIFLEDQLEGFPRKGPIRNFMDLVTTALSKNPYLTIEQKHETIDWYRSYFKGKGAALESTPGADGRIETIQ